ncbi:hypothetical protein TraAM80_02715 [Trypanosoma rangeli]|uniref:Uncharacterized protein n=1 Tax=Trypanosoma rangeli TaxID=5698 RepID=A0A422NSS8_TRYRA|nr:uncharacterized protein TraAM80_02715 [Trypanosoma rangeli]RNF08489.1 hypothetical protein TraAM80_02715 [Trypanosoma rangeli]|eukprot:RNF08489.1 hypothetical protein TraAM80_02715 [Trypanosoma rangeli]
MVTNAGVFLVLLLVTAVPPLFIYNPEKHPGESLGPPPAAGIFYDSAPNFSVRQKLYILFTLPVCALLNSLLVYVTYYRHLRHIQFRAELSLVAHANLKTVVMIFTEEQQLSDYSGVTPVGGTCSSRGPANHNLLAVRFNGSKAGLNYPCLDNQQHVRPSGISLDRLSTSTWFPELQELQEAVEAQFLRRAEVARAAAFQCFCQEVLTRVEKRMKLEEGSMANGIRLLLQQQTEWVPAPMMRVHLRRIELERRHTNANENNLESEP